MISGVPPKYDVVSSNFDKHKKKINKKSATAEVLILRGYVVKLMIALNQSFSTESTNLVRGRIWAGD